jgi:hypothetical protein
MAGIIGKKQRRFYSGYAPLMRKKQETKMFKLEQSIMEWRRQMLAAGIKAPVPLEELHENGDRHNERCKMTSPAIPVFSVRCRGGVG